MKPQIIIKGNYALRGVTDNAVNASIKEILAGIEEEGVPYKLVLVGNENSSRECAKSARKESSLGVGIGIVDKEAVLMVEKLQDEPLCVTDKDYRILGQNAARYVKGKYFLTQGGDNVNQPCLGITLESARNISRKVIAYAKSEGCSVVVVILNANGNPITVEVMEDAFMVSYEMAMKKAYTAVALKMPNHDLKKLVAQGGEFEGLEAMLDKKIITLGGGYPIYQNTKVIGGIGVSGGSVSQDIAFAAYGASLVQEEELC